MFYLLKYLLLIKKILNLHSLTNYGIIISTILVKRSVWDDKTI